VSFDARRAPTGHPSAIVNQLPSKSWRAGADIDYFHARRHSLRSRRGFSAVAWPLLGLCRDTWNSEEVSLRPLETLRFQTRPPAPFHS